MCVILNRPHKGNASMQDAESFQEHSNNVEELPLNSPTYISDKNEYQSVQLVEDIDPERDVVRVLSSILKAASNSVASEDETGHNKLSKDITKNELIQTSNDTKLRKNNLVSSHINGLVKSNPHIVFPEPAKLEQNCILRNNTTSFTIDQNSCFIDEGGSGIAQKTDTGTLNCTIIVDKVVPSICKLSIQFHDFEFNQKEESKQKGDVGNKILEGKDNEIVCERYGLIVKGGNVTKQYSNMCGNLTGQFRDFPFKENSSTLELFSTYRNRTSSPSFNLTVRQINCQQEHMATNEVQVISKLLLQAHLGVRNSVQKSSIGDCNQVIEQEEFVLQSPNYPSKYPNNINCTTIVYPSSNNICALGNNFIKLVMYRNVT